MPRKDEFLSQLLSSKTQEIVSSPRNYTAFLQTAAQNYKYRFQEQVLIHAQRSDATACAEIGVWNRLGRWVNRVPPVLPCSGTQTFHIVSAMCSMFQIPTAGRIEKFPFGR